MNCIKPFDVFIICMYFFFFFLKRPKCIEKAHVIHRQTLFIVSYFSKTIKAKKKLSVWFGSP